MRGLFCPRCRAKNNEEYRAVLKKRRGSFYLFILLGLATEAVCLFVHFCTEIEVSDYRLGFLLGLGVLYVMLVLGGAFGNDMLLWISWGLIAVYLVSYALLEKYYQSKI